MVHRRSVYSRWDRAQLRAKGGALTLRGTSAGRLLSSHARAGAIVVVLCAAACAGVQSDSGFSQKTQAAVSGPANTIVVDLSSNQIGRLTHQGNGLVRSYSQYDSLGRVTKSQHVIGNSSYVYTQTYGYPNGTAAANGPLIVQSTFPDGEKLTHGYDAAWAQQALSTQPCTAYDANNQCTALGAPQTIIASVVRNSRGQTTKLVYGDGTTTTHVYNDTTDLRLHQIQTFLTATPATIRQYYTYTFDANGNVTSVTDYCNEALIGTGDCSASSPNSTFTASYGYDAANELTSGTFSYGYDDYGNLINKEGLAQCYGNNCGVSGSRGPHALAMDGASLTYQYDANGNVSSRSDGLAITWNSQNMPIAMSGGAAGAGTQKFFLEAAVWKKVQNGVTTYYLPDLRIENGSVIKYFSGFAERSADGSLKFYHGDHLGSATLVTDVNGNVVHRQAYKPYGEDRLATPPGSFTVATGLRYQFNFKEREQDGTGYYDYGARMYDPFTGRWLSADSNADDGLNRYSYVRNNPLKFNDPTGHQSADSIAVEQVDRLSRQGNINGMRGCNYFGCETHWSGRAWGHMMAFIGGGDGQLGAFNHDVLSVKWENKYGKLGDALAIATAVPYTVGVAVLERGYKIDKGIAHIATEETGRLENAFSHAAAFTGHVWSEMGTAAGHEQAAAAALVKRTKGTVMESYARGTEAAARGRATMLKRTGEKIGPIVDLAILTVDAARMAHATHQGNPDHPAFRDAAGHGSGVVGGIITGGEMGAWCGPWCALIGATVGGIAGEIGGRALHKQLTTPAAHPNAVDERAQHMIDACGSSMCK